jgi:hypothetical protein
MRRKRVDPGAAGISKTKQLGYLVEGLACRIIESAANILVMPRFSIPAGEIEMCVSTGDDES